MPLDYSAKDAETAWEAGQYPAILISVEDSVAKKSGQPMQVWKFQVFDDIHQREQEVTEYVTKAAIFKLRQLAGALNCMADFKAGTFQADAYVNARVMVELSIEPSDGTYDDRNRINRISARPPEAAQAPVRRNVPAPAQARNTTRVPAGSHPADSAGEGIPESDIPFSPNKY